LENRLNIPLLHLKTIKLPGLAIIAIGYFMKGKEPEKKRKEPEKKHLKVKRKPYLINAK